ncbi:MAG: endoglucanase [Saprospiraceae bacterium]|jgi:endoglucanase
MKKITLLLALSFAMSGFSQTHDYALAQHLSTYFLGAQRCGDTKSWIQPEGGGGCHTTDGQSVGKDLSGGWHDCGDYIKFHVSGPYTAFMNLYGYDKFPAAYADNYSPDYSKGPSNGIPDVLDEVKIETDYLIKCIGTGNTIYWQIGDGNDHNSFNEPISNSEETLYNGSKIRTVYSATEGHSNAFGSSAAALALMSIVYKPYDATYAQSCLTAAIKYYEVAKINMAVTADAVAGDKFYEWLGQQYSKYNDEMGMGAAMLYRATTTSNYLTEAQSFSSAAELWGTFNYGSIDHMLFFEMYKITGTSSYLDKVKWRVDNNTLASCGYFHNTDWGSLRDAGNAAFLAALYHSESSDATAYSFAKSNIDFILGTHGYISADAPANFSFLIGYNELGGSYPQHPHHGAAFGKSSNAWTLYNNEDNNPGSVSFEYELKGGLAGGPKTSCGTFVDKIGDYVASEYCSYYNAAFTGAVAYINKVENNLITSTTAKPTDDDFYVFPNPAAGNLTINNNGESDTFEIYDSMGKLVLTSLVNGSIQLDISNLTVGLYSVKNQSGQKITRFVKN